MMSVLSQASSTGSADTFTSTSTTKSAKKRKAVQENDRSACWSALLESIRPQNAHEEFGSYVSSSLAQIKDNHLINTTKCKIQLILAQALCENAEKQLATPAPTKQVLIFDSEGRIIQQHDDLIVEDENSIDSINNNNNN